MPILDRVLGVAEAARDKLKETFGDPDASSLDHDDGDDGDAHSDAGPTLDVPAAYALLGLGDGATLADVRDAYRAKAKALHPNAKRDGDESQAQRDLDRLLVALELLEEHLVPLNPIAGAPSSSESSTPPRSTRKRATKRT